MKTYREMTESVLHKAGTEVLKRERRRRNAVCIAAAGLCFALLVTVLGMGMGQAPIVLPTQPGEQPGISADATVAPKPTDATQPPEQKSPTVKITYLTNVAGETTQETLSPNVSVPLDGIIRVADIRGLTAEEAKVVCDEEEKLARERLKGPGTRGSRLCSNVFITEVQNGSITMDFSKLEAENRVKNVEIETTENGKVGIGARSSGRNPGENKAEIYWPYVEEAYFNWRISAELAYKIDADPTFPLESIRDTVTITVSYANERTEVYIFDITVNEEGQIFVTQRGIPTEAA